MTTIDARGATAVAIADGVRAGKLRARDVAEQYLDRVVRLDGALGCYLRVDAEGARRRADAVDAAKKAGRDPGALAGVPLGVKDIFCTRGVETTCASKILRGFVPPYESTVTARVAVEQASTFGWERYVNRKSGRIIGMHTFGASAPLKELQQKYGFEPERVTEIAKEVVARSRKA